MSRRGQLLLTVGRAVAVWLLVLFALDYALEPSLGLRVGALAIVSAAALWWIRRGANRIAASLAEAAHQVEETHGRLRNVVLNAMELDTALIAGEDVGSEQLARAFLRRAQAGAKQIAPSKAAPYKELWGHGLCTLPFMIVALAVLGASPSRTAMFLRRVFALQTPKTLVLNVEPGNAQCIEGNPVTFVGQAGGMIPRSGRVRLTYANQNADSVKLTRDGTRFVSPPLILEDSAEYRLELGRALSPGYSIRLVRYPRVEVELEGRPPQYSGLPRQTITGNKASFLCGTTVRVVVHGSKDLGSVRLRSPDSATELHRAGPDRFETTLSLRENTQGTIEATDLDGLSVEEPLELEAEPDQPPVVLLNDRQREIAVKPGAEVRLAYHVADDLGLTRMQIRGSFHPHQPLAADNRDALLQSEILLTEVLLTGQTLADGNLPLELGHLLRTPGDCFDVYAEVTDNSPAKQTGRSTLVSIRAIGPAEAKRLADAETAEVVEQLETVEQTVRQARKCAEDRQWKEALEMQEQCTREIAELQTRSMRRRVDLANAGQVDGPPAGDDRLREALDAAHDVSREAARELRQAMQPAEDRTGPPPNDPSSPGLQHQQELEQRLRQARAFADPEGASATIRHQAQDFVRNCGDREPLDEAAAEDTETMGDRADFWKRRKEELDRLQQEIDRAEQQGVKEAAPWIPRLDKALQDANLSSQVAETEKALRRMDNTQAKALEQQVDQGLEGMQDALGDAAPQGETPPDRSGPDSPAQLIEQQRALLERTNKEGASAESRRRELVPAQESITDRLRALRLSFEAARSTAARPVDAAEGHSLDAEQCLCSDSPPDAAVRSQQAVIDALQQAVAIAPDTPPDASPQENGPPPDSQGPGSSQQMLEQASTVEDLVRDIDQLRQDQGNLRDEIAAAEDPDPAKNALWQADQGQIAAKAEELAGQTSPLDEGAARQLKQASGAAAEAQRMLKEQRASQTAGLQAACDGHLEAAARELTARLERSLEQCEHVAAAEEQQARDTRQQIRQLQQQQQEQQASPSSSRAQQSQVTRQCEQLARQCEQSGAQQTAQELRKAAASSQQAEQSLQRGQPQQARAEQQEAAQQLGAAEQQARQQESQAGQTKRTAAQKCQNCRQGQQLSQMAGMQNSSAQPGAGAESPGGAKRQETLAGQARAMARQVDNPKAAEHLRQAAAAAEAAAQAIEQGDPQGARSAQVLSARHLQEARRALASNDERKPGTGPENGRGPLPDKAWVIAIPPDMQQQVDAFFDSPKPRDYTDQLLKYSTQLKLDTRPSTQPPQGSEP